MPPDDLKTLIGQHNDPYHVALLRHAEVFAGRRAVKTLPAAVAWREENRPQPKECYRNAQSFAAFGRASAVYYEGYWTRAGRAVHHAWVVVGGEVIDFTAEAGERLKRKLSVTPAASAECYCGMPVPTDFVLTQVRRTGCWLPPRHVAPDAGHVEADRLDGGVQFGLPAAGDVDLSPFFYEQLVHSMTKLIM